MGGLKLATGEKVEIKEYFKETVSAPTIRLIEKEMVKLSEDPWMPDPLPTLVTCAVSGAFNTRYENPNHPYTNEEIAKECIDALVAGASSIHIHPRSPILPILYTPRYWMYKTIIERVKEHIPNALFDGCIVTPDWEENQKILSLLEMTPVNTWASFVGLSVIGEVSIALGPEKCMEKTKMIQDMGKKVQVAVYSAGDIHNAERWLHRTNVLEKPFHYIILPALPGCTPCTSLEDTFLTTLAEIRMIKDIFKRYHDPDGSIIMCSAGRATMHLGMMSVLMGEGIRVGMEDTPISYPWSDEPIPSNKQTVERIVKFCEGIGRGVATADEFRSIIGIKR